MYRTALSRILVVAVPRHALAARAFFVEGGGQATQDKLRAIMEEYRQANFQQELPSRVFKMILKAADENNDGLISVQEVENLLSRIGAQDQMSKEEIETIMEGMGIQQGVGVPVSTVKAFFLPPKSA